MANKEPVKYRIGPVLAIFIVLLAIFLDVLGFGIDAAGTMGWGVFVVLGYVVDIITWFLFPLIFFAVGAPFWRGRAARKKIIAMVTGYLVEALPWIGAFLPATTISVAVTIVLTWAEDRGVKGKVAERFVSSRVTRMKREREKVRSANS